MIKPEKIKYKADIDTVINEEEIEEDSSLSPEADYILNFGEDDIFDPDITEDYSFTRGIQPSIYNLSMVRDGDIIVETDTIFGSMGHAAIVYNHNKSKNGSHMYYPTTSYIQTIEAVGDGVKLGFLDGKRIDDFGVVILRVTDDQQIIKNALSFAYRHLGDNYSLPLLSRVNLSDSCSTWYCSELVNACYYNAGIDLHAIGTDGYVWPYHLINSTYTSFISVGYYFIDYQFICISNNKYKIRVFNNTSSSISIDYNSKLCNKNDGMNWTNLHDIVTVNIQSNNYVDLLISKNFLASAIALSTCGNTFRYITYSFSIITSGPRMTTKRSEVQL